MKLQLVPARAGLAWVRSGFEVLARKPLSTVGTFMAFLLASLLILSIPAIGSLAVLVLLPSATVGFMIVSQRALAGQSSGPQVLVQPLLQSAQSRTLLLQQGIVYALLTLLCKVIADSLDGGELSRWQSSMEDGRSLEDLLTHPQLQFSAAIRGLLAIPVSLLFWHAGALAFQQGVPTAKALFFSWIACWKNWAAFAVYGLGWAGVVLLAGLLMSVLGWTSTTLASLLSVPVALGITSAFYASLAATVNACFTTQHEKTA